MGRTPRNRAGGAELHGMVWSLSWRAPHPAALQQTQRDEEHATALSDICRWRLVMIGNATINGIRFWAIKQFS